MDNPKNIDTTPITFLPINLSKAPFHAFGDYLSVLNCQVVKF